MDDTNVEILLVEDNPSDVELALHAFQRYNISNRIFVARDGVEALDFLFGGEPSDPIKRPKVVLLDLKLPRVNGLEVLRQIKQDGRTRDIPVVVLTSSDEDQDISECYRLGVNSYITKPVDFDQFVEAAREIGLYWLLLNHPPHPSPIIS